MYTSGKTDSSLMWNLSPPYQLQPSKMHVENPLQASPRGDSCLSGSEGVC